MRRHSKTAGVAGLIALVVAGSLTMAAPASAFGRYHPGGFRGGYHGGYGGHRGLGVGAAVGLGLGAAALGAVAAGAAANSGYYNCYPVYPNGVHPGYGYDYYPDHGGYYGPY